MSKPQKTKNEQQNDLCITSEQLTEQLKKGELPDGWYYVKDKRDIIRIDYFADVWDYTDIDEVNEVLAEVPSFEEWQASENYIDYLKQCISVYESKEKQHIGDAIAYNELAEENKELKEILERHKKATAKAQIRSCDLEIINTQLKSLLKECRDEINPYIEVIGGKKTFKNLIKKIDEVLE